MLGNFSYCNPTKLYFGEKEWKECGGNRRSYAKPYTCKVV